MAATAHDTADGAEGRIVQVQIPSSLLAIREALSQIVGALGQAGIDASVCGSVEIVLAEALNNVVEHAYGLREDGTIMIKVSRRDHDLVLQISDDGASMPPNQVPTGRPHDLSGPPETLPEGGFGWFLIRQMTDDVEYTRQGGHNVLRLTMRAA